LRVSVGIALLGVAIGCAIGVLTGVLSGLLGGWTDRIIMMIVDFQLSIPFLLIVLVGIAVFGTSMAVLIVLVGTAHWETYARLTRGQVLTVREFQFVEAAVALGATTLRIARRHILPNIASPIIVLVTLNFPSILLLESSLSFLGIGVQPPTASLGRMVGEGRDYMMSAWWLVMSPAAFIVVVTLCMQLIGDWLRDVIDVRLT
jgi:peptide/nickel transport system permease protein